MKRHLLQILAVIGLSLVPLEATLAQSAKPNMLVIFGDDIGIANISAYSGGLMGYETPSIDRLAKEGIPTSGRTSPPTPSGTGNSTTSAPPTT